MPHLFELEGCHHALLGQIVHQVDEAKNAHDKKDDNTSDYSQHEEPYSLSV
jgi:hypothetical protein